MTGRTQSMTAISGAVIILVIIFTLIPLCMSVGFGEKCDNSNTCAENLVCSDSKCQCGSGLTFFQNKCIDTSYGKACTSDDDCPRTYGTKCIDEAGKLEGQLLCYGVPKNLRNVHVDQYLDESLKVRFNITWELSYYTGPTWFVVDVEGKDYFAHTYNVGSITITKTDATNLRVKEFIYGGWLYKVTVKARTPVGEGPKFKTGRFVAIDSKPSSVQNVKVEQDKTYADTISLSFECPDSRYTNGNITAFIVRKTLISDEGNVSSEYTIPHNFVSRKCKVSVMAYQLGGIEVPNNYTFEVKIKNRNYEGDFSSPVELFAKVKKPLMSQIIVPESLISPYTNETDQAGTSFDVLLCSSCIVDPVQGPVKSAAIVLCFEPEMELCSKSLLLFSSSVKENVIDRPQDICRYDTWAKAKASNFSKPYRTTPDGWHAKLLRDNSKSFIYKIGVDSNCNEDDVADFCNGPLPSDKRFAVSIIVCNDAGCDQSTVGRYREIFHTKAAVNDDESRGNVNIGLVISFGIAIVICIALLIFLVFTQSRKTS